MITVLNESNTEFLGKYIVVAIDVDYQHNWEDGYIADFDTRDEAQNWCIDNFGPDFDDEVRIIYRDNP